jgi:hypothetical protein
MFDVIKNKGKMVKAYQLGSKNAVIAELIASGRVKSLGEDKYEIYSQEAVNGQAGGEVAVAGDWIKLDNSGYPYPNDAAFFEANHRHVEGDIYEQIPKPLKAWDTECEMCPEIVFLMEKKGLRINIESYDKRYSAELWGTTEVAAADAVIIFYSIDYADNGDVVDASFNFVARDEFDRTYSVVE